MLQINRIKLALAYSMDRLGLNTLGFALQRRLFSPFIRIVNYHDISSQMGAAFEQQLRYFKEHYRPTTQDELAQFIRQGKWPHTRPGLLITFDDGLRSNYEVAAPLLEKHGFQGVFFVPIRLLELDPEVQPEQADRSTVIHHCELSKDPRIFMTIEELRDLAKRHIIGCHTANHVRLATQITFQEIETEVQSAKDELTSVLGKNVETFAWVGGEEWAYSGTAHERIVQLFQFSFTTNTRIVTRETNPYELNRTHIEADFPLWLTRFQLSGVMDLLYAGKRARVSKRLHHSFTNAPQRDLVIPHEPKASGFSK